MTKLHITTAAVVKVSIGSPSGNSVAQFVRRGDLVPAGVDEAQLDRLVKQGFIEDFEAPEPEHEPEVFSQEHLDAAVREATAAKDAEMADLRKELTAARADADKAKAAATAKTATPPKA